MNSQPLPANIEAEESVLRAMMCDPDDCEAGAGMLRPDHFYRTANRAVFESCLSLTAKNLPVDVTTLKGELEARGMLQKIGGASYLAELLDSPVPANLNHYCRIIREKWTRRRLIETGNAIVKAALDSTTDVDPLHRAQALVEVIDAGGGQSQFESTESLASSALDRYETAARSDSMPGVPSGFYDLDRITAGFQPGDLIILGARPSMGKTALALAMARNAATAGYPVGFFSLEMSKAQLFDRLVATEANVNSLKFRNGSFSRNDWANVSAGVGAAAEKPIYIDDTPGLSHREIAARVRQMKRQKDIKLVFVDYLQLATGDSGQGRVEEVSSISRALKSVARSNEIALVALSQLSRALESRNKKRPCLSDLRDSGAIEQDADVVLFLYRDEVYRPNTEKQGVAELTIAKHRTGPTGRVELRWNRFTTAFQSIKKYGGNYGR